MRTNELQKIKQRFGIVGHASALDRAIELAMRVASTDMGILITGENGSGKESFAKIIHYMSARKHGNFIAVNCGAIPEGTIDSELFGHERGAFTSASQARKGYFEESDEGSIFLDEIGEMPLHTQPRLLRVLENREYLRVGSSQKRSTSARVIAATNVDLQRYVEQKLFREDLYYRIAQVEIRIPPLRERGEDIVLLFRKYALDFAQAHHKELIELTPAARDRLLSYSFPGNVRQLKNIVWQLATLEEGRRVITADVLGGYLPKRVPMVVGAAGVVDRAKRTERELLYSVIVDMQQEIQEIKRVLLEFVQQRPESEAIIRDHSHLFRRLIDVPDVEEKSEEKVSLPIALPAKSEEGGDEEERLLLKEHEERLIRRAIDRAPNYRQAAKLLGISERTLFRKIQRYHIEK